MPTQQMVISFGGAMRIVLRLLEAGSDACAKDILREFIQEADEADGKGGTDADS